MHLKSRLSVGAFPNGVGFADVLNGTLKTPLERELQQSKNEAVISI